jgi:hypothetical protein
MDLGRYDARIDVDGKGVNMRIAYREERYSSDGNVVHPGMTPEIARELGRRLMLAADAAKEKQDAD